MKKPLAVGDRVRVYGYSDRGTVFHRGTYTTLDAVNTHTVACMNYGTFHKKQCRRLVKKQRKVYYGLLHGDQVYGSLYTARHSAEYALEGLKGRVMELVERRRKEKK